jgi:predicted HicB family RNase H-like nuclease
VKILTLFQSNLLCASFLKERVGSKSAKDIVKRSKANKDSPRVSVRLPVKLHKLAKQKAKQKGLSLSDLTRLALEKYLKAS